MDFRAIFQQQQRVLELELALARARFAHNGLRGNAVEIAMRDFLERHLPRALTAGTGEIIATDGDAEERRSGQVDLVISNMMQPFLGQRDIPTTFLIEGVYMAGEAKSRLGRADFKSELDKARRFRSLRARNLSNLVNVIGHSDWQSYFVYYRPYFLIAMETKTKWKSILFELMNYIEINKMIPLDSVFLIDEGVVLLISPCGPFPGFQFPGIPFQHKVNGTMQSGSIHVMKTDIPLALFMAWLGQYQIGFMSDQIPIGAYLQESINDSMSSIQIGGGPADVNSLKQLLETRGMFGGILEMLRTSPDLQ